MLKFSVLMNLSKHFSNKSKNLLVHQPLEQEFWKQTPQKKIKEIFTVTNISLLVYYEKGTNHQAEGGSTCQMSLAIVT